MEIIRQENRLKVNLVRGEELMSSLEKVVAEYGIKEATITGIGATDLLTVGFLTDYRTMQYKWKTFEGDFEITSLMGNIRMVDGAPKIHLHINFADEDYITYGGHVDSARISVLGQIYIDYRAE